MNLKYPALGLLLAGLFVTACGEKQSNEVSQEVNAEQADQSPQKADNSRFDIYANVSLAADLSHLSENQRQMLSLLIDAAEITNDIFWLQVWGDRDELLDSIEDPKARQFAFYNYGPWDRLAADQPFLESHGPRPLGARFYPEDMSKEEFEAWDQPGKDGLYSLVQRDASGQLQLIPYSIAFADQIAELTDLLYQAADLAEDAQFGEYLRLRALALLSDEYQASDMAWMDMKNNPIELVIGPVEVYQDALYNYRAAFETFVLVKDMAWSERLARFAQYMPELQRGLPVPDEYKAESAGSDADLNAYDLVYCAGDCNSGSKTIAINLPNDEEVQLAKGTRRLQLKNSILAKFNQILVPIADELIADDQRQHITFDSFFGNIMFHEVAHGLGIKYTLDGEGTVSAALMELSSSLEEGKADILGLYMVQRLREMGEITEGELMDDYVSFMAGIFRSVRFGASSAHGRANMIRFNFFSEAGAFSRDDETGKYRVHVPEFEKAVEDLSRTLLMLQGDGNYDEVAAFVAKNGNVGAQLQADLDRLTAKEIPVDIVYQQGKEVLGL
ncbi:MAG: hypothetical protein ACI9H8_000505 [Lysobacterales bacterium]|jgi:hypothetical protein